MATQKRLLLRTLGNIGSLLDLSSHDSLLESVLSCFDGDENVELVRTSAAMSLGDMAIGAKDRVFLPFILSSLSDQKKSDVDLYLISVALHNVLISSTFDVAPHLVSLLSNLLSRCENQDEGTRNLIAKCLGTCDVLICKSCLSLPTRGTLLYRNISAHSQNNTTQMRILNCCFALETHRYTRPN